jgi:hypothetical protein
MSLSFKFKKYFAIALSLFMLLSINALSFIKQAQAQTPKRASAHTVKRAKTVQQNKFVDSRYKHNRSYPVRGHSVRSLPRDHRVVIHGNSHYYSSHGVWYRPHNGRYVVIAPPIGLFVPVLPFAYSTIWMHGMPYYYANETYYTQTPGGYVVIEPPQGEVSEIPPAPEEENDYMVDDKMFIYPRQGQSEEQQDNDRYECHQWAMEQTNYDPTKIPPEISADQLMQKRADYRHTMADCLDSRGYTTK